MTSMLSAFSSWFVNPRRNPLARIHMLTISNRLKNYGLRYDDLYDPYFDLDIKEALCRLPREVVDARHQRLKRAMDLSMKHQYLPDDVRALQTPFKSYLSDMLALVSAFADACLLYFHVLITYDILYAALKYLPTSSTSVLHFGHAVDFSLALFCITVFMQHV
uniref:Complex III subunit VII n=1 Tax=Triticum urartu TaxID=4572 RepID=A0A8R7RG46_TRIUA